MTAMDRVPAETEHSVDALARRCQELETQLRQARKMEVVGRLVGGVAHDFNNLLTVMVGFADLVLLEPDLSQPVRDGLAEIRRASQRAAALTNRLLSFTRRATPTRQVLDVNAVIADMEPMLRRLIPENIHLAFSVLTEPAQAKIDQAQLEQVVLNLVLNARDAMNGTGTLTVETANVDLDSTYVARRTTVIPGPYTMIAVSDTGCGMDAETQSQLFTPYFTTKEAGKGTGLGLGTVDELVSENGGYIWLYSEPGRGTTFKIYLPRLTSGAGSARTPAAGQRPRNGRETVLLVEDNDWVRELAQRILEQAGYTVLRARASAEARNLSARHQGPIHLLLTDVILPQSEGPALAAQILRQRPDTRVLYMSGYPEAAVEQQSVGPDMAFLQKPFTPELLLMRVREVLDAQPVATAH